MRKIRKLIIALSITAIIVFSLAFFTPNNYFPSILMYHSVSPDINSIPTKKLIVTVKAFERQMRFLREQKYHVLPLEELGNLIRSKKKIPARTVAITFDDGYKDNYTHAFPILKKYNLPATIFIIFNEVGRQQNDRLSWEEIKEMRDSGIITFGSHTLGPRPLVDINNDEELKKEIYGSKIRLEERLGKKVNIFSYPGGMFNEKIRQMVIDAGYQAAVTTWPKKKIAKDDLFALKRLRVSPSSDNILTFWLTTTGYSKIMRERKYNK